MRIHLIAAIAALIPFAAQAEIVKIATANTVLAIDAQEGSMPRYLYYGPKVSDTDINNMPKSGLREIYPAYGLNPQAEAAVAAVMPDGNMTLELGLEKVSKAGDTVTFALADKVYPVKVNVNYRAFVESDVVETWAVVVNNGKKSVTLTEYKSAYLPIRRGNVWLNSLYGTWANEAQLNQEPLTPGVKIIKNKDGVRNSHTAHAEVMFSLDGKPSELRGRTIGAALCYGGNYELKIDTDDGDFHHFFAGINPDNSEYHLAGGETFETPALALTYSTEGNSGVSRNFHKWGRENRLANGDRLRKILLNSWEGVYFDINEAGMGAMMNDIASMGGELFVMDDGWFGAKYQRNSDNAALGDWTVDLRKLPNGLKALTDSAADHGVDFGIWIEPEMTNTVAELYEQHPDWIVKAPNRDPQVGRGGTQLVLDFSNPKVQDFVVSVFDSIVAACPGLDYVKWDANMGIQNHGSQYLTADNQSHLYIDWHRGFAKTCDRIRAKYPDLTIQACASGGGRANWGVLPWFDEFWTSDNTDALQRVYIQWGTSYFFPAMAMGSHISAAPNHQTFRTIPMKYRIDVAISGRLGMEIQPKNMTDEEKNLCRNAIADYKRIRPLVQTGNIYRLISPFDKKGCASLMYVDDAKEEAVAYWYKTETFVNQHLPRLVLAGLDPDKTYYIEELNRIDNKPLAFEGRGFSGKYLMEHGLDIPLTHDVDYNKLNDYASRVLHITSGAPCEAADALRSRLQQEISNGKTLFGHHDDPVYGHGWKWDQGRSDVHSVTGAWPAVMSWDLGGQELDSDCNLDGVPFDRIRQEALAQHARGGINTFSWHPRNPVDGRDSWQPDSTIVSRIMEDSAVRAEFDRDIANCARFIRSLKDSDGKSIGVIFRPWHEHTGSWFWWGKDLTTPVQYRFLWEETRRIFEQEGVDNVLWAYSPDCVDSAEAYMERYPGDRYVDILGADIYYRPADMTLEQWQENAVRELNIAKSEASRRGKLMAFSETGLEGVQQADWWTAGLLPVIEKTQPAYVVVWRNAHDIPEHFFAPYPGHLSAADFKKFSDSNSISFVK